MPSALVPLANLTLGSAAATVTFSSISSSYRDLYLVCSFGFSVTGVSPVMQLNADTGANYSFVIAQGNGSSASSPSGSAQNFMWLNYNGSYATTPVSTMICNIMDYSATDKHKTTLVRAGDTATNGAVEMSAHRWASTAAVTSIKIYPYSSGNFVAGSTFALYGVSA